MERRAHGLSIFSQSLDRVAFVAYLLGAVVPLVGLGYLAQVYVLPELRDVGATAAVVGTIMGMGVLSLGAFLVLRRTTRESLARMDRDNRQLARMLETSRALAGSRHRGDAAEILAGCALDLSEGSAAFLLSWEKHGDDFSLTTLAGAGEGAEAVQSAQAGRIEEVARLALETERPAKASPGRASSPGADPTILAVPIVAEGRPVGVMASILGTAPRDGVEEHLGSLATLAALGSVALRNADLQDSQRNFFTHVTELLVSALDNQMDYHRGHAHRVAMISNRIGHGMGFDAERLERLHFASLLHDIGMLRIPLEQHEQKEIIRRHPSLGHRMLHPIRVWEDISPFVLYHHEWFDGRGYPEGLAGDGIPLESRIIGLAEAVDSMTSKNSYKPAVSLEEAQRRVREASGSQFDPQVVQVFLSLCDQGIINTDQLR